MFSIKYEFVLINRERKAFFNLLKTKLNTDNTGYRIDQIFWWLKNNIFCKKCNRKSGFLRSTKKSLGYGSFIHAKFPAS